ncbi:MAG: restriction endonuclease subunit S [Cryobacterium sp.]|nr:restriction endonuclease subunit S [Cryobacterium sp.]
MALGDVLEIDSKSVAPELIADGATYIGLESIGSGGSLDESICVSSGELKSAKFVFDERHVLFGKLRPNLGKVARPTGSGVCSTDIFPLLPSNRLDRNYVAHFLLLPSTIALAASRTTGVNLPRINGSILKSFEIPLPPLPEQRRIADILDRADNLRAQRRRALVQLDSLRDSLFFHTFGAGIDVPSGTISDLLSLRSGKFLPASAMNSGGDVSVYGGNGVNGTHDQHLFDSPQIVIGRVGAYCGAVHVTTTRSWVTDNAMVVGWDLAVFERDYLAAALAKANLNQFASQSGQPLLSASKLANVAIPIPTLDLQREFGERMTYLDGVRLRHQDHLVKLEELFASLQHRAFQGEF